MNSKIRTWNRNFRWALLHNGMSVPIKTWNLGSNEFQHFIIKQRPWNVFSPARGVGSEWWGGPRGHTVGQLGQNVKKPQTWCECHTHVYLHISDEFEYIDQCIVTSWGLMDFKRPHMDAYKPFNSKLVTLTMRGGFFTKFSALAHGAARQFAFGFIWPLGINFTKYYKNYVFTHWFLACTINDFAFGGGNILVSGSHNLQENWEACQASCQVK